MKRDILGDFIVGYNGADKLQQDHSHTPKEPSFIAIIAGRLFREENLPPPVSLIIDQDGVLCLTTQSGLEFGLFLVAGKTYFIDGDGRSLNIAAFKTLLPIISRTPQLAYA